MNALQMARIEVSRDRSRPSEQGTESLGDLACRLVQQEISYVPNRGFLDPDPLIDAPGGAELLPEQLGIRSTDRRPATEAHGLPPQVGAAWT